MQPVVRVLFICRGSVRDGLGHVIRTRVVASHLSRRAAIRIVVIGDRHAEPLLVHRGLAYSVVSGDEEAARVCDEFGPQVVVFDLMQIDDTFFAHVAARAMTVSLSPVFNALGRTDLFFNRTAAVSEDWQFAGRRPELRCGLPYAVVRDECERIPTEVFRSNLTKKKLAVMISMGGSDANDKTLQVLRALGEVNDPMLFWLMLGEGYAHSYEALVECIAPGGPHEIILAKTTDSMWRIMQTCSVALLAAGTVTYEAAFAGLPSINVFDVPRHGFLVEELVDKGVCLNAGYPFVDALEVAKSLLLNLSADRGRLLEMHQRCHALIDGNGADRIARELIEFYWGTYAPLRGTEPA